MATSSRPHASPRCAASTASTRARSACCAKAISTARSRCRGARALRALQQRRRSTASEIATALDLDQGYLSRLLRTSRSAGWSRARTRRRTRGRATRPHRPGQAGLRPAREALAERRRRYAGQARRTAQRRLVAAMATIENLLGGEAADKREATSCASRGTAISAGSCRATPSSIGRNTDGASRSKACARRSSPTSSTSYDPKRERCWIAEMNGENVGTRDAGEGREARRRAAAAAAGRSESARARPRRAAGR